MDNYLKQATASQSRTIGPFLDDTDFKTAETALTIANTDIKLMVNGGASANKNSGGGTHRVNGNYGVTFDATDTATVGELTASIVVAGALPVFHKFFVVEEAVYDALFAAAAPGYVTDQPVNATKIGGTTQTGRDLGTSVLLSSGTGTGQLSLSNGAVLLQATQTGVTIPTVTTLTNAPSDSSGVTTLLTKFGGITLMKHWLGAIAGKQAADTTAQTELRASGAGSGTFDPTTDSIEALRDNLATATALSTVQADTDDIQNRIPAALAADGSIKATVQGFLGTAFTEGAAGRFAANFKTFFNVGSAAGTQDVIPTVTTTTTATNLTNAPTAGDLTATMKTSVTTAATAATPVAASVTGNVGGNVVGSVASITANVNADIKKINGTTVNGDGSSGTPWGP